MNLDKNVLKVSGIMLNRSDKFCLNIERLNVKSGEIVCLAGANGSGKTSFLDILTSLITSTSGQVSLNHKHLFDDENLAKKSMGYVPDDDNWLIAELTAAEYFAVLARVYLKAKIKYDMQRRVMMLARQLMFTNFNQQLGELSHGNKKKVQIIAALMHRPKLIILDELRNGLDPIAIHRAEEIIKNESSHGAAVLAATHDLWWAERFADQIVMIRDGQIVYKDQTVNIIKEVGSVEAKFIEVFAT